jgi:hypothetical protein
MNIPINEDTIVAETILDQLGGNKFRAMTGAKHFGSEPNALTFRFPNKSGANACRIELNSLDLYDMKFIRIRKKQGIPQFKTTTEHNGVYADQLQTLFTEVTGLYTHL